MGTETQGVFATSATADYLPFAMPRTAAVTGDFSPGTWRLHPAPRRKAGMWQVRDARNDVVADVYNHADAPAIASSKALLVVCVKMLSILHPLALEGRLSQEDMINVHSAVEVVQRAHLTVSKVAPTRPPATQPVRAQQPNAEDIDLDPAFRTWCAHQYRTATAQGVDPPPRSELRERFLRGER